MESLEDYIERKQSRIEKGSTFVEYLYSLMDKYNIDKASDLYNQVGISRQLWSSIISNKSNPSLNICIRIVFALKCTNQECKTLFKKAGYTLASSSKYALIIRYCIENKIYDINQLNRYLEEYDFANII